MLLKNALLLDDRRVDLLIAGGRIQAVMPAYSLFIEGQQVIDLEGRLAVPGLIDLQVNGAGGADVMSATPEALDTIGETMLRDGVTTYLPTVTTHTPEQITKSLRNIVDCIARAKGAQIAGSHLEGPFLHPKRKGAHNPDWVIEPDLDLCEQWYQASRRTLRLITLAPEQPGALESIGWAVERGIRVSIGHSTANPAEVRAGARAGITLATHVYNAMEQLMHRDPGTVGGVLADKRIDAMLIADDIHVAPEAIMVAAYVKGPDHTILVSDAMTALGMPDGVYEIAGRVATVKDGAARLPDGTLAGVVRPLLTCWRNFTRWTGWSAAETIKCVSSNPARMLGLERHKGQIQPGFDADFVIFDGISIDHPIHATVCRGELREHHA